MTTPSVALSRDFMEAYSRLPKAIQKKVREFTEKFQRDPTAPGLNFERIADARDSKVRSLRIDQAYRAIVVHPPRGDVYLCVWVDYHDEAYRWARSKVFEVNPKVGSLQLYDVVEAAPPVEVLTPAEVASEHALFAARDDEELLLAGVPAPLLASVRAVATEVELDALAPHIPTEAADVLYLLAAGSSLSEALAEAEHAEPRPASVDVEDFRTALERAESQQTFRLISTERELEAMLDAPLAQWRVFLHPTQRRLVTMDAKGPARVLGGAGTGKTVVLMHRAAHLATKVFTEPGDKLLVTTYTANLARDLETQIGTLAGEAKERIEVVHVHAWARRLLSREGHKVVPVGGRERRTLMEQARASGPGGDDVSTQFLLDEWDEVVQAQDVRDRDAYLTARRVGRGTRIGRRQRVELWAIFERYRELLRLKGKVEFTDMVREARLYIEEQEVRLPYRAVLADEVQDFTEPDLKLLRTMAPEAPNSLYLVGDAHQRIYGRPIRLASCGIEIRGRARRLRLNYRTTDEIRRQAVAVLEAKSVDDLDGGEDSLRGYRSVRRGPRPEIRRFDREADEGAAVVECLKRWLDEGVAPEDICVAARTGPLLEDRYEPFLERAGIAHQRIKQDALGAGALGKVRTATFHRMKGLEFKRVLLVHVQEGSVPLVVQEHADDVAREEHAQRERCLLHVAMTRARDVLVVTGFGVASPLLGSG